MEKQIVLIAGGTGLIGSALRKSLEKSGHEVRILSRKPSDPGKQLFHWDPARKEMDEAALQGVTTIFNLSGAGIADKRWTARRKQELIDSRIEPALFLASFAPKMNALQQYISSSGINAYGNDQPEAIHTENDPFGNDFLSQVVRKWEEAADAFQPFCPVAKVRTSLVMAEKGGALETMAKPVRMGFASALGSGNQWMPWIHIDDLVGIFMLIMEKRLSGSYNATAHVVTNEHFTAALAHRLGRKMWLPNAPSFALKLVLGEMSSLVLEGLNATSHKIKQEGFEFQFEDVETALKDLIQK